MIAQRRLRTPWELGVLASALGDVPRLYDRAGAYEHGFQQPQHRLDDSVTYMRPDENGELLMQASCGHHYVMVPQEDVWNGVEAPCTEEGCRWRRMMARRAA